jgi:hypothetical protein
VQHVRNNLHHCVQTLLYVVIGKAQHAKPQRLQKLLADGVFFQRVLVYRAVHLDDDLRVGAVEIRDKTVDAVLAAELESGDLAVAQAFPQRVLGGRGVVVHLPREGLEPGPEGGGREIGVVFAFGIVGHGLPHPLTPSPRAERGNLIYYYHLLLIYFLNIDYTI